MSVNSLVTLARDDEKWSHFHNFIKKEITPSFFPKFDSFSNLLDYPAELRANQKNKNKKFKKNLKITK